MPTSAAGSSSKLVGARIVTTTSLKLHAGMVENALKAMNVPTLLYVLDEFDIDNPSSAPTSTGSVFA